MKKLLFLVCLSFALSLCLAAVSHAHKVNIFAYVDGNNVVTDSGFNRKDRVHGGTIKVYDAAGGKLLLTGTTDDKGHWEFPIPQEARDKHMDLRLHLNASTGHEAEWVVKYKEYGDASAAGSAAEGVAESTPAEKVSPTATPAVDKQVVGLSKAEVEAIVHREVAPIKSMLADMHSDGPSMTEIAGGIGYIIGLFGIFAYMKGRNR